MQVELNGKTFYLEQEIESGENPIILYKLFCNEDFAPGQADEFLFESDDENIRLIKIKIYNPKVTIQSGLIDHFFSKLMDIFQKPLISLHNLKNNELTSVIWERLLHIFPSEVIFSPEDGIYIWDKAKPYEDDMNRRTNNLGAFAKLALSVHSTLGLDGEPEDLAIEFEKRFETTFKKMK
jgi:hypothetical protein